MSTLNWRRCWLTTAFGRASPPAPGRPGLGYGISVAYLAQVLGAEGDFESRVAAVLSRAFDLPPRISCRHCRCSHGLQQLYQLIQFCAAEQAFWPPRRDVGEWGFIEPIRGDNTVLRKVIDDEVHEFDLVG